MSTSPVEVQKFGQSIWIDNIRRELLTDGTFQALIDESGVVGVTSNPSIFQKAIGDTDNYDDDMVALLDLPAEQVYERLAIEDIQRAADLFKQVYEETDGRDGYVSLEVSPLLARQTEETIEEAKRLFAAVDRPNVMIKIPATPQGIPAIEEVIASGINVNITLIFAVSNYLQVAEAYIKGLERRVAAGEDVTRVASVASFFLSRIDTMIDRILENNIHAAKVRGDNARVQSNNKLLGQAALASARLAYKRFRELFYGERFARLQAAGARVQRPLWASTSTKNPVYSDVKYIENLIGKDTVNTVPPETLKAFGDHGKAERETILDGIDDAETVLDMLVEVGLDIDQITKRLQDDGVEAFIESFEELISQIKAKQIILTTGIIDRQKLAMGIHADAVNDAVRHLDEKFFNGRIWNKDGSLWKTDGPSINKIENRLGWLNVLETIDYDRLKALRKDIGGADFAHVVVLGMGGGSLAPEVLMKTFGNAAGFPALLVLDSTHPQAIKNIEDQIDLSKTLFIVASKSGGTIETRSFYRHFHAATGGKGEQFIAVTDPGSQLEQIAKDENFREIFLNPADIGGRYSALSYFGLVPAACIGMDIDKIHTHADAMVKACSESIPAHNHPGLILGAVMGALAREGRDKACIFASKSIQAFGDWAEQLIAESTGKENCGIVPVVGATVGYPHDYATDRAFYYIKLEGDEGNDVMDAGIKALREAGHPRVTLFMEDKYALMAEFFRWEYATAVTGQLLKINPFNEPNVTESKQNTDHLLEVYQNNGALPTTQPFISGDNTEVYMDEGTLGPLRELCKAHGYDANSRTEMLAAQFTGTHAGDYFGLLVYLPQTPEIEEKVRSIQRRLRHATRRAVTVGYGPRFLHSTGQLHKGDANKGVFFQITAEHPLDIAIPDVPYTFGTLNDAQAAGDMQALQDHHRRVMRLHIKGDWQDGLDKVLAAINFVEERSK